MPIFYDSRYADEGSVRFTAYDSRDGKYKKTVFRQWPAYETFYFHYNWVETDRIDLLALEFLGSSSLWWQIMDLNPQILNPFTIEPGTRLRIPRG